MIATSIRSPLFVVSQYSQEQSREPSAARIDENSYYNFFCYLLVVYDGLITLVCQSPTDTADEQVSTVLPLVYCKVAENHVIII